jgi:ribonuclease HI
MRKKKKSVREYYPSAGPLPLRFADRYANHMLVFSDASLKKHGGLASIIFQTTESSPHISTRTVEPSGSNRLELAALLFAWDHSMDVEAEAKRALFSDNQDAITRLKQAQMHGTHQDVELHLLLEQQKHRLTFDNIEFCWIKGHGCCRGNLLADQNARHAADGNPPPRQP